MISFSFTSSTRRGSDVNEIPKQTLLFELHQAGCLCFRLSETGSSGLTPPPTSNTKGAGGEPFVNREKLMRGKNRQRKAISLALPIPHPAAHPIDGVRSSITFPPTRLFLAAFVSLPVADASQAGRHLQKPDTAGLSCNRYTMRLAANRVQA